MTLCYYVYNCFNIFLNILHTVTEIKIIFKILLFSFSFFSFAPKEQNEKATKKYCLTASYIFRVFKS